MTETFVRIKSTTEELIIIVPRIAARADGMTPRALGLYTILLSHSKDWCINVKQLVKNAKNPKQTCSKRGCGRDAIREDLKILKNLGYVTFTREKDEKGRWICYYDVHAPLVHKKSLRTPKERKKKDEKSDFQKFSPAPAFPAPANPCIIRSRICKKNPPPSSSLPESAPPERSSYSCSLRSEEEDLFYTCLNNTLLSPAQKRLLSNKYSEPEVERAVRLSKTVTIKKSLMGTLVNILQNPDKWEEDKTTQSPKQKKAEQYNAKLKDVAPELYEKNQETIPQGYVHVLHPALRTTTLSMKAEDFEIDLTECEQYLEEKTSDKCPRLKDTPQGD